MGPDNCDEKVYELIEVCFRGAIDQVQALLSLSDPPDVNGCNEDETTPLQAAASSGNEKLVELLLNSGAQQDIDCCNSFGWTAVMHAAYHGHLNVLNILGEYSSVTPLMAAAMRSQQHICENLINLGANTNGIVGGPNVSVLMMAALMAHISTVQLLVTHAADTNATTCRGQSAMHLAAAKRRKDVHTFLESKTASKTVHGYVGSNIGIFEAIKAKNHRRVRECLQEDPQCGNRVGEGGETPLMLACIYGRMDFVTMLISNDAMLDAVDVNGKTALIHAIAHGKTGTAKYLIHAGADVDMKANDGTSALDMAAVGHLSDRELLHLLVKQTARPGESPETPRRRPVPAPPTRPCLSCPTPFKKIWKNVSKQARRVVGRRHGRTAVTPAPRVTIAPDDQIFVDKSRQILDKETVLFESLEEIVGTPTELVASTSSINHFSLNTAHQKVNLGSTYETYNDASRKHRASIESSAVPMLDLSMLQTSRIANRRSSCSHNLDNFKSFRSPAYLNALSMGPGRPTPIEPVAPPVKCKTRPTPANSSRESSLPHSRTQSALVSPTEIAGELSSSQSSAGNGGSLNRRRRQYAMSNTGALGTGMTHLGVMRRRAATGGQQSFARPHSYHMDHTLHHAGMLRNILNSSLVPSGRPHSYHDADSGLGSRGVSLTRSKYVHTGIHLSARDAASESELPVTPTRKSFAFNFSAHNLNKHESSPQLQQSDSAASSINASEYISNQPHFVYAQTNAAIDRKVESELAEKRKMEKVDLRVVLKRLSLLEFVEVLEQNEVDVETLVTLTESDLFELGLTDPFSRGKLMAGINIIANCPNGLL